MDRPHPYSSPKIGDPVYIGNSWVYLSDVKCELCQKRRVNEESKFCDCGGEFYILQRLVPVNSSVAQSDDTVPNKKSTKSF